MIIKKGGKSGLSVHGNDYLSRIYSVIVTDKNWKKKLVYRKLLDSSYTCTLSLLVLYEIVYISIYLYTCSDFYHSTLITVTLTHNEHNRYVTVLVPK